MRSLILKPLFFPLSGGKDSGVTPTAISSRFWGLFEAGLDLVLQ